MRPVNNNNIQVIQDAEWHRMLRNTTKLRGLERPDSEAIRLANFIWITKLKEKIRQENIHKAIFLKDHHPPSRGMAPAAKPASEKCKARTLTGKCCSNNAIKDGLCRRHHVSKDRLITGGRSMSVSTKTPGTVRMEN